MSVSKIRVDPKNDLNQADATRPFSLVGIKIYFNSIDIHFNRAMVSNLNGEILYDVFPLCLRLCHVEQNDDGENATDESHGDDVIEEDGFGHVVPRDKTSGIGAEFVTKKQNKGTDQSHGGPIAKRYIDAVPAADDAQSKGPECGVGLARYPSGAGL